MDVIATRAAVLAADSKLDQAEEFFLQVHQAYDRTLGSSDPLTWTAACNLAVAQQMLGKLDLAENTLRGLLGSVESTSMPDDPSAIRALDVLGSICLLKGRYDEAGELFLRALPIQRRFKGPRYFELLRSMLLLLVTCLTNEKPAEAEKIALGCLHEHEENSVSEIHMCLGLVVAIRELYQKQGQLDRARNMLKKGSGRVWA